MTVAIKDLPSGQPNYGTIKYDGYPFSVLRKAEISGHIGYDEADRAVTHIQYRLSVRDAVIWANDVATQGVNMARAQDILSQPGKELIIDSIGFDNLINTSRQGTMPDIIWGVKPRAMNFRPTGGETSWMFDWECEFNVSRCADPELLTADVPPLMAFNYDWTSAVSEEGLMQRTLTGYIQVPAVRALPNDSQDIQFDVVAAWDAITVAVPNGFRRTQNVHSVSKAKNRIDFSIVDTELTSDAYPAGIVEAEIDIEDASQQGGLCSWIETISGTLTVAPGYPKSLAAVKFLAIVFWRVERIKQIAISSDQGQPAVVPVVMRLRHKLFSRTSSFSVGYLFATDATKLLQQSGIWDPVPGSDYQQWAQSMQAAGVWSNHGVSGLKFDKTQDRIITACVTVPSESIIETSQHPYDGSTTPDLSQQMSSTISKGYTVYESKIVPVMQHDVVIHKYAQEYNPGDQNYQDHVLQYRGAPDQFVRMVGRAVRLNAAPEMPQLNTVGTKPVELIQQGGWQSDNPVVESLGNRLYVAEWDNLYRIKGQPIAPPQEPGALPVASVTSNLPLTGNTIMESTIRQAGEEEQ